MHEKRRAPTDDYILRTNSSRPFRLSAPPRRGHIEFELAEPSASHSSDCDIDQFVNNPNYRRQVLRDAPNCVTGRNSKIPAQPPANEPPPYSFQPCSSTVAPPRFPEPGYSQDASHFDTLRQDYIRAGHLSELPDSFAPYQHYPVPFENRRDFRVLPLKLADDPARSDIEGDDRHLEHPRQSHGDRRPAPLPSFSSGPISSVPHPQHQYQPYPSHSPYPPPGFPPPPGFGPFEGPKSPQHSRHPPLPAYPAGYPPLPSYPPIGPPPSVHPHGAPDTSSPQRLPTFPPVHRPPGDPYLPFNFHDNRPPLPIPGYPPNLPGNPPPPHPIPGHHPYALPPGPFPRVPSPQPPTLPGVAPPPPMFGPPAVLPSYLQTQGPRPYELKIRQQPERARMCGFGEKDRRPIDPPPIVEIIEGTEKLTPSAVQSLVLQCTLWNEDGTQHRNIIRTVGPTRGLGTAEELPVQTEERHARVLMGDIFANALHLEDDHGQFGYFCLFPDISVRVEGIYRLRFDLLHLSIPPQPITGANQIIAVALSDRFQVFPAKKFSGMSPSTPLIMAFAKQGVKLKSRKKDQKSEATETET